MTFKKSKYNFKATCSRICMEKKKKKKEFLKATNQMFSKVKKKTHFQIQKYVRFTRASEMEQTRAGRKKEKCCGPLLKAADQLVSAKAFIS